MARINLVAKAATIFSEKARLALRNERTIRMLQSHICSHFLSATIGYRPSRSWPPRADRKSPAQFKFAPPYVGQIVNIRSGISGDSVMVELLQPPCNDNRQLPCSDYCTRKPLLAGRLRSDLASVSALDRQPHARLAMGQLHQRRNRSAPATATGAQC